MHDRRAASRVEQWLEATRWSDALSLQCSAPSDETIAGSDAPAAARFWRLPMCSDAGTLLSKVVSPAVSRWHLVLRQQNIIVLAVCKALEQQLKF